MNKNCAFTICATNYIGLAQVLEKSIFEYSEDLDFYIVVADEPRDAIKESFVNNILIAKQILSYNYTGQKWYEMAFKYDLTEFCTSIKPACIKYFFNLGYEKCLYFDPDIFVFSSLEKIYGILDKYSAIVTPHITQIETDSTGNVSEQQLIRTGTFNLGFIGLQKTPKTLQFLTWWSKRLEDFCFRIRTENLFTDQKWIDLMPGFFGSELYISLDKGMNMAPWNFHERRIVNNKGCLKVVNRLFDEGNKDSLMFVHYSGYNYSALLNGEIEQNNINEMPIYEDLNVIFNVYRDALLKNSFTKFIDEKYSYGYYSNGFGINNNLRKLYRALVEADGYSDNPFSLGSLLYKRAKKIRLISANYKTVKYSDISQKSWHRVGFVNSCLRFLCKIIGIKRYYMVTRFFRIYGIWENHYFILGDNDSDFKLRRW